MAPGQIAPGALRAPSLVAHPPRAGPPLQQTQHPCSLLHQPSDAPETLTWKSAPLLSAATAVAGARGRSVANTGKRAHTGRVWAAWPAAHSGCIAVGSVLRA